MYDLELVPTVSFIEILEIGSLFQIKPKDCNKNFKE